MTNQDRKAGHPPTVAVFGAAGHTGRFVVAELLRRGLRPLAVGRDSAKLTAAEFVARGVAIAQATIEDPASLDRAFAGADAVINCAGPFLDTANAVVASAVRSRIHYLDVTAEQPSVQATYSAFDAAARAAGIIVLPAMAFYGGLADLLATMAIGSRERVDGLRVGMALDSWHPTLGTRITGARNTAQRLTIIDGRLAPVLGGAPATSWDFLAPFGRQEVTELPFSEAVVIARHLRTGTLHSHISQAPLRDLRDAATPPPVPADETGRSAQIFQLEVIAAGGGETVRAVARGRDIYAVSGALVCEAAQRILTGETRHAGAAAPGEIFDARSFLEALAPDHLTIELRAE